MAVFSLPLLPLLFHGCAIASCDRVALRLAKPFLVYGAAPNHLILPSMCAVCGACACVCVFVFVRLHASNVSNVRVHHLMMTIISASQIRIFSRGPRKSEFGPKRTGRRSRKSNIELHNFQYNRQERKERNLLGKVSGNGFGSNCSCL